MCNIDICENAVVESFSRRRNYSFRCCIYAYEVSNCVLQKCRVNIDVPFFRLRFRVETHGLQRLPDFLAVHELYLISVKHRPKDPDEGVSPTGPGIQTTFEFFKPSGNLSSDDSWHVSVMFKKVLAFNQELLSLSSVHATAHALKHELSVNLMSAECASK